MPTAHSNILEYLHQHPGTCHIVVVSPELVWSVTVYTPQGIPEFSGQGTSYEAACHAALKEAAAAEPL